MHCFYNEHAGEGKVAASSFLSGKAAQLASMVTMALALAGLSHSAVAANSYWDANGATAGAGGPSPNGTWGLDNFWSTSSGGTLATAAWLSGDTAIFSAGTDATGSYTIGLSGAQTAGGLTFEEGIATIGSGALTLNGTATISVNASPTKGIIAATISGSAGVTKTSAGELVLQAANLFTGGLTNRAGTITLDNDSAAGAGSIVVSPTASAALHVGQTLITVANNVQLLGATSTIEIDSDLGKTLALNGVITGPHAWSVNGPGKVVLGGAAGFNTFAGALTVAQGTLVAAKNQALGATVNNLSVSSGATLAFQGGFEYDTSQGTKTVILNGAGVGGGAALDNVSGNNIFDGHVILVVDSTVGAAADSLAINGPITGLANLTKTGPGSVDLTGTGNTYLNTLVSQGTFGVFAPSVAGVGVVTVSAGATLVGNGSAPGGVVLNGTISPGSSPDTLNTGSETWNGGGSYVWEVNDAAGAAGSNPGWDLLNITGGLNMTATPSSKFTIYVASLDPSFDLPGDADNFNNTLDYTWTIASTTTGITGFDPAAMNVDVSNFSNPNVHGKFVVELANSNKDLVVKFIHPPFITSQPAGAVKECGVDSMTFTVGASGTPILSYQWKKNGFNVNNGGRFSGATSSALTISPVALADTDSYTVEIVNTYGTTNSLPAVLTVHDTIKPVLTPCPANIFVSASAPTVVTYTCPTANDVCDGPVAVVCTPPSGSTFPVGNTAVTATATDGSGNSQSCTFYVTICPPNPATVYVDDDYVGMPIGTPVAWPNGGPVTNLSIGCEAFATINGAVATVASGGTVQVAAGTYNEDVVIGKPISVLGAGAGSSIVVGPIGGPGSTFAFTVNGIVLDGFTVTRAGNNTTDWNNPNLNSAGLSIAGSLTSGTVRNCLFTGNRTGIDINNSGGITVRDNVINFNRTGMILRNQTDNLNVTENEITDNWTDGLVFLDASGGSNIPAQTATNCTFFNNNISGNWYGQIVDRQSGGSLPVPGTNLKNFSGNWLGTAAPVVTTLNTTEPGYAVQIPVAYGGSAVNPGGAPTIAGPASANVDYTPWLDSGSDTSVAYGFQGDFSVLHVGAKGAQVGTTGRVQEGIDLVSGSTVLLDPGTYTENDVVNKKVVLQGTGSGGNPVVDSIITAAAANTPTMIITASGANAGDRLTLRNLRVTGATGGGNPGSGIQFTASGSYYTFDNVSSVGNAGNGICQNIGSGANNDIVLTGCSLSNNGLDGFRVPTGDSIDGLTVTGSHFDGNATGIEVFMGNGSGSVLQNVNISSSSFINNSSKGFYAEKLSNASFSCLTISGNGTSGTFTAGMDINLKYGNYQNIQITDSDVINSGVSDLVNGAGITVKARGTGSDPSYAVNPATLNNVTLSGLNITGCPDGLRFGESGKNNVGPTGVTVHNSNLAGNLSKGIRNESQTLTDAERNWWGSVTGPTSPSNAGGTGVGVGPNIDFSPWLGDSTDTLVSCGFQPNPTPIYYLPHHLAFSAQPGGANLGALLSPQPEVQVIDENGGVALQFNGSVALAIGNNPGGGVLAGTLTLPVVSGLAKFTDIAVTVGGGSGYTLVASTASPVISATSTPFDIANPLPSITSLSPFWIRAGSSAFTLTVNGGNFVPNSVVYWNGTSRTTHFQSAGQVTADISASDIASVGTAQVKVVSPAPGGGQTAELTFRIELAVPTTVYVDDGYVGKANDSLVAWPCPTGTCPGTHIIGYDAFATIQGGVTAVAVSGTVNVAAGTYPEAILVNKSLALIGAQAGVAASPRSAAFTTGVNGPKADPSVEAIITAASTAPSSAANDTVHVMASNVTVDGFVIDGNNPALAQGGAILVGGINTDSRRALETEDASGNFFSANNVFVKNNIIQNFFQRGVELVNPTDTSPPTSGSVISGNVIRNFGLDGILLAFNAYSDVTSNIVDMASGSEAGIWLQDCPNSGATPKVLDWSHNTVTVCQDAFGGIWANLIYGSATTLNIHDNVVNASAGVTGANDFTFGIYLSSLQGGTTAHLANNVVGASGGQFARGIALWNLPTSTTVTLNGDSAGSSVKAISLHHADPNFGDPSASYSVDATGVSASGSDVGVYVEAASAGIYSVQMNLSGNSGVHTCGLGVEVVGSQAKANIHDNLASITGNAVGVDVDGGVAKLQNNTLTGNTLAGVRVQNGATVDAGDCTGSNVTGLGSSTGGNVLTGYLFDDASPFAILNLNASGGPEVFAHNNSFGAGGPGSDIRLVLFDAKDDNSKSVVHASDSTPAVTCPPTPASVQCLAGVQVAATTIDGFYTLGGASSTTEGSVGHIDSASAPGPNDGIVTRAYTVIDACGNSVGCNQFLPVDDTTPPSVVCQPATKTLNIGDSTVVVSPADVFASGLDNCGGVVTPVSVTPNTFCYAGTYSVTLTVTDGNGNNATCNASVTVIDNRPTPTVVYVDDGYVGLPDCTLVDWPYTGGTSPFIMGYNAFATIGAAITKVANGGTVHVAPGNYTLAQSLIKQVNLLGAQAGVDARGRVVGAPNPAVESIVAPAVAGSSTIDLNTGCALSVIDGFVFSGGGGGGTIGVIRSSSNPIDGVQILNNYMIGFSDAAIWFNRGGIDVTLSQNVMDGAAMTFGSQIIFLNTQNFPGLEILNNSILNGGTRAGLFVDGTRNVAPSINRQPVIVGNYFANNSVGINMGSRSYDTALIALNTFTNSGFDGLQGGPKDSLIISNLFINNGRWGLALTSFGNTSAGRGATNDVVSCNTFTGNGFVVAGGSGGLLVSSAQPANNAGSLRINFNNIYGNTTGMVYSGSEVVNATNNWWGAASGPTIASNPGGTGDQILGTTINYNPYLTSDNSYPAILCPANIVVGNDAGQCSAVVNFAVTATSGCCGGAIATGSSPASGSTFPVGTTMVTSMATNSCGKVSVCSFLVTVVDVEPPVIGAVTAAEVQPYTVSPVNVKNCANTTVQGTVNISVAVSDQCPLLPPVINLTNGANVATATLVNQSPPGVFNYTWAVGPSTAGGTWTATIHANDTGGGTTSTFTLCVNPAQVTGLVQLEGFTGTGTVPLHTRTVVFVATDAPGAGANVLKTWTIALSNVSGDTFAYILADVPSGTAGLSAKTAWTLRSKLGVTLNLQGQASGVNFSGADVLHGGDLQGDNQVNFFDYSILGNNFFTFNSVADITGDGQVNLDDYFILSVNWFTAGDPQ